MVLESLLNPIKAERRPWEMFFIGFLYSSLAIFLALWIFEKQSSLISVFLTVLAAVPITYNAMRLEEKKDVEIECGEVGLLKEHAKALNFFVFLFLGITVSYVLWFVFLPSDVIGTVFSVQTNTVANINAAAMTQSLSGMAFVKILLNNIRVLTFCILFSFLYGSGAIFILTWNASVIAAAAGSFIRANIHLLAPYTGAKAFMGYVGLFGQGIGRYLIHGIPEIFAYFVAGLAGGIISVAVIRHDFGTKKFEKILLDSSDLLLMSLFILFIAALMEVYLTPVIFS